MKISILSDLHLEIKPCEFKKIECDVMILAGDIHNGTMALSFIEYHIKQGVKHILYVLGNHEFYNTHNYSKPRDTFFNSSLYSNKENSKKVSNSYADTINQWLQFDNEIEQLHVLHNKDFIYENIRFIGTTIWTNFDNDTNKMYTAKYVMNDYNYITYDNNYLTPQNVFNFHLKEVKWLEEQLNCNKESQSKLTFVITHHLPSYKCVDQKYKDNPNNCFWASSLDHLMEKYKIDYWIHGHTHASVDTKIHNTRVICNPRGYGAENDTFDYNYTIKV
jgi:predicted phosphodiesterase